MQRIFIITLLLCTLAKQLSSQSLTTSVQQPTDKNAGDGQIVIKGLKPGTSYTVSYTTTSSSTNYKKAAMAPAAFTTDINGALTIAGVAEGKYEAFTLVEGANTQTLQTTITIKGIGMATQSTKFFGAAYANFTGIEDDTPNGFSQFYARISQPLNAAEGISKNASFKERFIWVRNFLAQLTYANTDQFKLYPVDTLQDRYLNRVDLLSRAYFHGNISLNLLTFVVPKNWKKSTDDMAHIYLDLFTSMAVTRVTDTSQGNTPETVKKLNVKSHVVGMNLKAHFQNVFDTRFNVETSARAMYVFPASSTFDHRLNPQMGNVNDLNLARHQGKELAMTRNSALAEFSVQVLYNTGTNPPVQGNQVKSSSSSNIFVRYNYVTNFARSTANRLPNNFFQFQLGYSLDITKLFSNGPGLASDGKTPDDAQ